MVDVVAGPVRQDAIDELKFDLREKLVVQGEPPGIISRALQRVIPLRRDVAIPIRTDHERRRGNRTHFRSRGEDSVFGLDPADLRDGHLQVLPRHGAFDGLATDVGT